MHSNKDRTATLPVPSRTSGDQKTAEMSWPTILAAALIIGGMGLMMLIRDPARGPDGRQTAVDTAPASTGAAQGTAPQPSVMGPPSGAATVPGVAGQTGVVKDKPNLQPATPPR